MTTKTVPTTKLNVTTNKHSLKVGMDIVAKAVATRSSLPILTHVKLTTRDGRISLMATDLEMWVEHTLPETSICDDAAVALSFHNFMELLSAMPNAEINLRQDDDGRAVHIKCNKANYKLLGLPADEFPLLPNLTTSCKITLDRSVLGNAIKRTIFAASTDKTRMILNGALLVFDGTEMLLVATDTHRLTKSVCAFNAGEGSAEVIVPAGALSEIARIMGNEDGEVELTISSNQMKALIRHESGATTTLITRLIDGQFPNYERVIPTSTTRTLIVQRAPLMDAVKRASIVARESANRIIVRTSNELDKLTISAESGNIGRADEEIECHQEGETCGYEIAFNSKYMLDVLSVLDAEGIRIELTEPLRPGVIREVGSDDYLCVLMPMQVV